MSIELSSDSSNEQNSIHQPEDTHLENRATTPTLPTITQSKFFSPAFNAAIFDGPIRIYFAQYQESDALKIYFQLQEELAKNNSFLKTQLKKKKKNVFLMVYPAEDIFIRAFETASIKIGSHLACEELQEDTVIGISGSLEGNDYESIIDLVSQQVVANS